MCIMFLAFPLANWHIIASIAIHISKVFTVPSNSHHTSNGTAAHGRLKVAGNMMQLMHQYIDVSLRYKHFISLSAVVNKTGVISTKPEFYQLLSNF